eukprot:TRINITY_DN1689_c0_g2_i8.p1 TRINITY_DN1689_c0_g2~~TRINITY_DN1689_c0_g2_i8.p1  ORF type:complete len:561 (+),score=183.86 TRINITY_DN1689_c0_g2_i8:204-1886(+)
MSKQRDTDDLSQVKEKKEKKERKEKEKERKERKERKKKEGEESVGGGGGGGGPQRPTLTSMFLPVTTAEKERERKLKASGASLSTSEAETEDDLPPQATSTTPSSAAVAAPTPAPTPTTAPQVPHPSVSTSTAPGGDEEEEFSFDSEDFLLSSSDEDQLLPDDPVLRDSKENNTHIPKNLIGSIQPRGGEWSTNATDYEMIEQIGIGISPPTTVWRYHSKKTKTDIAIKIFDLEDNDSEAVLSLARKEMHTSISARHENLVTIHTSLLNDSQLWVLYELTEGSLIDLIKYRRTQRAIYLSKPPKDDKEYKKWKEANKKESLIWTPGGEPVLAAILLQVLSGLVYIHHSLIHRNLKGSNILVKSDGTVCLSDFGLSAAVYEFNQMHSTFVSTNPCWLAPEVMDDTVYAGYTEKADIWSLGICCIELALGKPPFFDEDRAKVPMRILTSLPPSLENPEGAFSKSQVDEHKKEFSTEFRHFVRHCCQNNPAKRPSAVRLLEHKFIKGRVKNAAKSKELVKNTFLIETPPMGERFRLLKAEASQKALANLNTLATLVRIGFSLP